MPRRLLQGEGAAPHRAEIALLLPFLVAAGRWMVRWRELRRSGGAPLAAYALAVLV